MYVLRKIFVGLFLVLAVSLNANATFRSATMPVSDFANNNDMGTRSNLLVAVVGDDVADDAATDDDGKDDDSRDDGKDDDSRDDDSRDDVSKDDVSKEDDGKDD